MKLTRYHQEGTIIPAVFVSDDEIADCSNFGHDWDESFFEQDGSLFVRQVAVREMDKTVRNTLHRTISAMTRLLSFLTVLCSASILFADDWPQFRGSSGNGVGERRPAGRVFGGRL